MSQVNKSLVSRFGIIAYLYFCVDLEHAKHQDPPVLPQLTSEQPRLLQRRTLRQSSSQPEPSEPRSHTVKLASAFPAENPRLDLSTDQRLPPISKVPRALPSISSHRDPSMMQLALPPITSSLGRCGLVNTGNTCYVNSALQCLYSIPDLVEWVRQQPAPTSIRNVTDSYVALVQSMWSDRSKVINPCELKDWVTRSALIFSGSGQKDAHEFMNSLLNAIASVDPSSPLVSLFRIHTQSTIIGNSCLHRDTTTGSTTFLSLPLPELGLFAQTKISLVDLIKDFCQEEEMVGDYYCQSCHRYQSARQQTTIIDRLPRTLVVQLKRFPFDGTDRKLETFIDYRLEYRNLLSNNDHYTLCAVLVHHGSLAGGHYTALTRDYPNNRWYLCNDRYVDEINSKDIPSALITQHAYVLLYSNRSYSNLSSTVAFWSDVCSILKYILPQDHLHLHWSPGRQWHWIYACRLQLTCTHWRFSVIISLNDWLDTVMIDSLFDDRSLFPSETPRSVHSRLRHQATEPITYSVHHSTDGYSSDGIHSSSAAKESDSMVNTVVHHQSSMGSD